MKASDLNRLLNGLSTGVYLKQSIHREVSTYSELMKKQGSSNPVIFDEDEDIILDSAGIKNLLQETLSGRLSSVDLAYICDCLTLGEKVDYIDESIKEIIFEIADPEINGGFKSDNELKKILEECK